MRTCTGCEESKPASQFRKFGRGLKKMCMACEGGGSAVSKTKAAPAAPASEPVKLNGHLEVLAGLGFRASLEGSCVTIEQDRQDGDTVYTHSLALAPHEARQLIEWIESKLEGAS